MGSRVWAMSDRYEGKPFLRLLECYVLWSVDELPADLAEMLEGMTPNLASVYETSGTWQDIVAAQMEFPSDLVDTLRGMWDRALASAGDQRDAIDPESWAQQVVDSNFT